MSISIYRECSQAARRLLKNPALADSGKPGVFTELDVISLAAKKGWTQSDFRMAMRDANEVMGTLFRTSQVARFGPVIVPGQEDPDYVRIASKVAYADAATGPKRIQTPNGTFNRVMVADDTIRRTGARGLASNRNDLVSWKQQDIHTVRAVTNEENTRVTSLQANLKAAHRRIEKLDADNARLRAHKAALKSAKLSEAQAAAVTALVADLIAPLERELQELRTGTSA